MNALDRFLESHCTGHDDHGPGMGPNGDKHGSCSKCLQMKAELQTKWLCRCGDIFDTFDALTAHYHNDCKGPQIINFDFGPMTVVGMGRITPGSAA